MSNPSTTPTAARFSSLLRAYFPKRPEKPLKFETKQAVRRSKQAQMVRLLVPALERALGTPRPLEDTTTLNEVSQPLTRRMIKSMRELGKGPVFEAGVAWASQQLMAGLLRLDPKQLHAAYETFGHLLPDTQGGAILRGTAIGLVPPKRLGKQARAQHDGDLQIDRQDALFLTALQFANEQLAQQPTLAHSAQDLYLARMVEEAFRSALLQQPMIFDQAGWNALRASPSPDEQSLHAAMRMMYPQLRDLAAKGRLPALQFLVDRAPSSGPSNASKRAASSTVLSTDSSAFDQTFDPATLRSTAFSDSADAAARPLIEPPIEYEPASALRAGPDRLHMIVQLDSDPTIVEKAERLYDSAPARAVLINASRPGLLGWKNAQLLQNMLPETTLEMHVVGHLSQDAPTSASDPLNGWTLMLKLKGIAKDMNVDRPMSSITLYMRAPDPTDATSLPSELHLQAKRWTLLDSKGAILVNDLPDPQLPPRWVEAGTDGLKFTPRAWTAYATRANHTAFDRGHEGLLQVIASRLTPPGSPLPAQHARGWQIMSEAMRQALHSTLAGLRLDNVPEAELASVAGAITAGLVDQQWGRFTDAYAALRKIVDRLPRKVLMTVERRPTGLPARIKGGSTQVPRLLPYSLSAVEGTYLLAMDAGLAALQQWHERNLAGAVPSGTAPQSSAGPDPELVGLTHAALASVFFEQAFTIDGDRLMSLAASNAVDDKALYDAVRRIHTAMQQASQNGLMTAPEVLVPDSPQDSARLRANLDGLLAPAPERRPLSLSGDESFENDQPMRGLDRAAPEIEQTLDRGAGMITLTWSDSAFETPRTSRIRFTPLADAADSAALTAQDEQIAWLDDFILAHFFKRAGVALARVPLDITLEGESLKVGRLTVAQRSQGQWRVDPFRIREAAFVAPIPFTREKLADWMQPSIEPQNPPHGAPERLRILVQMSPDLTDTSQLLYQNHPDESIWIQADNFGDQRVVAGEHLLHHLGSVSDVKWVLEAHGAPTGSNFETRLADYSPAELSDRLQALANKFKLAIPIKKLSLLGCQLETEALPHGFAENFIRHGVAASVLSSDVTVTAAAHMVLTVPLNGKLRRTSIAFPEAPYRYHEPGIQFSFKRDPVSGSITKTDKYSRDGVDLPLNDSTSPKSSAAQIEARDIHDRVLKTETFGLEEAIELNADDALSRLRDDGVVNSPPDQPIRVDPVRLSAALEGGDTSRVAISSRVLVLEPDDFTQFSVAAEQAMEQGPMPEHDATALRHWLSTAKQLRAQLRAVAAADKTPTPMPQLESSGHLALGVLGIFQLASSWKQMDNTQRGLSITQAGSFVISPLAAATGRLLARIGAGSRLLTLGADVLQSGAVDVGLSAVSLALIAEQWKAFNASGQGTDSFAYRSLVANTAITVVATAVSLGMTGVQVAALVGATASEVVAGLAAGMGEVGLPFALLVLAATGAVNTLLWNEEYGKYLRGTTWEIVGMTFAKFFGFETLIFERAEVAGQADQVAKQRAWDLSHQEGLHREYLADLYAKAGFRHLMSSSHAFSTRSATFKVDALDPPFDFVLQDTSTLDALIDQRGALEALPENAHQGSAWIGVEDAHWAATRSGPVPERPQLFELSGRRTTSVRGGHDRDVFLLDSRSVVDRLYGMGGADHVQFDAQQRLVTYRALDSAGAVPYRVGHLSHRARTGDSSDDLPNHTTELHRIPRLTIRNAGHARIEGGPDDEFFDITGEDVLIRGEDGRNTFQLRPGNVVVTSSDDLLLWTPGIAAKVCSEGSDGIALLLQTPVPYEALRIQRLQRNLVLSGVDGASLVFEDYFKRLQADGPSAEPSWAARRPLAIRDGSGLLIVPVATEQLGAAPTPLSAVARIVHHDQATQVERHRISASPGASVLNRIGPRSGFFTVRLHDGLPVHLDLQVPWDQLAQAFDGDDLVIYQPSIQDLYHVAPDPKQPLLDLGRIPLKVRLKDYRHQLGTRGVVVMARPGREAEGTDTPVLLQLPAPGAATAGPVQRHAAGHAAAPLPMRPVPTPASPVPVGTRGPDVLDSSGLAPQAVLAGGDGRDLYVVRAGDQVRIDNAALDQQPDLLRLQRHPDDIVMSVSGDDLQIGTFGRPPEVQVLGHQVDPSLRHLALQLTNDRTYLLPMADPVTGALVHDLSRSWDDVLIAGPGLHLLRIPALHQMMIADDRPTPRVRRLFLQAAPSEHEITIDGTDAVLAFGFGELRQEIRLIDYYNQPDAIEIEWRDAATGQSQVSADCLVPAGLRMEAEANGIRLSVPYIRARMVGDDLALGERFQKSIEAVQDRRTAVDAALGTLYLQSRGFSAAQASAIAPRTLTQIDRALALRDVAGVALPTSLLAGFAQSEAVVPPLSALRHRALIQYLVETKRSAEMLAEVLGQELTLPEMRSFDRWAAKALADVPIASRGLDRLEPFAVWLRRAPDQDDDLAAADASLMAAVLEHQGRTPMQAKALAQLMVEAGTTDEVYLEAMLALGLTRGDRIGQLRRAGVQPAEVLMGNIARFSYHDLRDHSAQVSVSTSDALRQLVTIEDQRYWLDYYLMLDGHGYRLHVLGESPAVDGSFDLGPGQVLDRNGQSPRADPSLPDDSKKVSGPERLLRQGFLQYEERPPIQQVQWFGRSVPANLVDGVAWGSEATAWLPWLERAGDKDWKPRAVDPKQPAFVQFDFAHKLLLTDLTVWIDRPVSAKDTPLRGDGLSWAVEASSDGLSWAPVGTSPWPAAVPSDLRATQIRHQVPVDTGGVPYRHYRLTATGGRFLPGEWISEVTFQTAAVADPLPPRQDAPALSAGNDLATQLRRSLGLVEAMAVLETLGGAGDAAAGGTTAPQSAGASSKFWTVVPVQGAGG